MMVSFYKPQIKAPPPSQAKIYHVRTQDFYSPKLQEFNLKMMHCTEIRARK